MPSSKAGANGKGTGGLRRMYRGPAAREARLIGILALRGGGTGFMDAHELITRYAAGQRDFSWANLHQADLSGAVLSQAVLYHANLSGANLEGANLEGADLIAANLREANLSGANVTLEQLAKAASLKGAILPDGTVHK